MSDIDCFDIPTYSVRQSRSQQPQQSGTQQNSQSSTASNNSESNNAQQRADEQNNLDIPTIHSILRAIRHASGRAAAPPSDRRPAAPWEPSAPTESTNSSGGSEGNPFASARLPSELFSGFLNLSPTTFLSMVSIQILVVTLHFCPIINIAFATIVHFHAVLHLISKN